MKVVAATLLYPPRSRVGAWLATHENLRELARRGHDVQVRFLYGYDGKYELDGVNAQGVGASLFEHLDGADVVISHHGDRLTMAAENARLAGIPHVVMVHGDTREASRPDADLVVFNAASNVADWATDHIVVHPHTRSEDHCTSPGREITLVNYSAAKGGRTLRAVAKRCADRKFLAVQGGYGDHVNLNDLANVRRIASTAAMKRHVWSQTRILLMPSERETWGMAGVEAMCSGIPVIAHPTPGLIESLGDAGIFVDRDDTNGWVSAIESLDNPAAYSDVSQKARRRAAELCDGSGPRLFADELEKRFA